MSAKKSKIKLKSEKCEQSFEFAHALSILRMKNSQWQIAEPGYIFENNEIVRKPESKKTNKK